MERKKPCPTVTREPTAGVLGGSHLCLTAVKSLDADGTLLYFLNRGADLFGGWHVCRQERNHGEHVLEGIQESDECEHTHGDGVVVSRLENHLERNSRLMDPQVVIANLLTHSNTAEPIDHFTCLCE